MKKIILTLAIFTSLQSSAQVFAGMGIGSTVNANAGILVNDIELSVNYNHPYSKVEIPAIVSVSLGKMLLLTNNDQDNFTLTLSAGVAFHSYTITESNGKAAGKVKETKPIYSLEAGKDWNMGRLYVSGQYSGRLMLGVGIKFYFD